jgi:3-oxosteroid 1-dehydrogenase
MIGNMPEHWDRIVDVAVIGTGGAALTAATLAHDGGSEVLVLEKAPMIGGTTAVSGGVAWLPLNHHEIGAGIDDSRDEALAYLRTLTAGREHDPALLEVFVDTAAEAIRYLEEHTPVRMQLIPNFPDYYFPYPIPGKKGPGRSLEPVPFPVGTELPEWRDRLATRGALMSLGAATTLGEDFSLQDEALLAELARREAEDVRPKGAALVAMLFKGLLERGVDVMVETPAYELVVVDGTVVGVRCEKDGKDFYVGTRQGVVLACGGFEWNEELVRTYIGYAVQPLSPGYNEGDGLVMAIGAGAELANMQSYWGQPAMFDPEVTRDGKMVPQFEWGRGEPSSIIVNQHGQRFANEAIPYNDFPKAYGEFNASDSTFPNTPPAWMIFDEKVRQGTRIMSMFPGQPTPEWVPVAGTIEELAELIGLPADALLATVERFNTNAALRVDPDFDRTKVGLMGPGRVAPIDTAPYYAVVIHPGALGTNGGPRLTADAQVRAQTGGVVGGLYAAGNTAASGFGWAYPSGGGTIGQGLVVGYRAGRHIATLPKQQLG